MAKRVVIEDLVCLDGDLLALANQPGQTAYDVLRVMGFSSGMRNA